MKKIIIFTDGASSGNPGSGGWGCVIIFCDDASQKSKVKSHKVVELGGREERTTNNRMELIAIIEAFEFANKYGLGARDYEFEVYSDSSYAVNGITKWIDDWIKNDWKNSQKKPVMNRDLWEQLSNLTEIYKAEWRVLPGHSGVPGNERADKIAVGFRDDNDPGLYHGSLENYDIDVLNIDYDKVLKRDKGRKKTRSKAKAYSYLSLVDGVLRRHMTWSQCELCVRGRPNVKFKKALDAEEEEEIVEEWGYTLDDIKG